MCLKHIIVQGNVFIMPLFHEKAARHNSKPHKPQFLIKSESMSIATYHRIELKNTESQFFPFLYTMLHKKLADMSSSHICSHRITGIADMTAPSDIIRMEDIEPDNSSEFTIISDSRKRLLFKKYITCRFCQ